MTVTQLIHRLQRLMADYPEVATAEVRVATQPTYPLALELTSVCPQLDEDGNAKLIWLGAADHPYNGSPYAPSGAFGDEEFESEGWS